jgi:hypothetical protein
MQSNQNNGAFKIEFANVSRVTISNTIVEVVLNSSMPEGTPMIVLNDIADGIYNIKVISGSTQILKRLEIIGE